MKKIDMILNGTKEQYPSLISKLSNILEPFALLAVGKAPVYIGRIVEELGVKQCKDCGAFIFNIDGNDVAHVDTKRMEASVFGGETFSISIEDAESVRNTVDALENRKGGDHDIDENPIKDIIEGMPKELKSLLGAAIVMSKLRKKGDNEMDILKQLEEGKPFSGRNGAFTGRVEPQSIEGDTLKVICDKSGTRWHENWELQHVIWAFERGDYFFL